MCILKKLHIQRKSDKQRILHNTLTFFYSFLLISILKVYKRVIFLLQYDVYTVAYSIQYCSS